MRNIKKLSHKSNDTKKIRKILNEEIRMGYNANSDSETEEIDLRKELHPLGHYINNREEMIEQMFSTIKEAKLKRMMPPILKNMPLDELKADCLIHLLGMSTKRIFAVLEGREVNSSSDSETDSDNSVSFSKTALVKPIMIKQEGCSDISDNSEEVVLVDPDVNVGDVMSAKDIPAGGEKSKKRPCLKKRKLKRKNIIPNKKITQENQKVSEQQGEESHESISDNENDLEVQAPKEGKNLLEILELEMRARAIRALLNIDGSAREENQSPAENSSRNELNSGIKLRNMSSEDKNITEQITPVKHFRKKKRKIDDVIIIAPKVVTIDLTDETATTNESSKIIEGEKIESLLDRVNYVQEKSVRELHRSPQLKLNVEESSFLSDAKAGDICNKNEQRISLNCTDSIEPMGKHSENIDQIEQSKNNWAQRWLESKEVKKVVSTSKICGNIRKRIKSAKLAKKSQEISSKMKTDSLEIQGSVCEYKSLSKFRNIQIPNTEIPGSGNCDTVITSLSVQKEEMLKKDNVLSVEQVQDVTSTKSENTTGDDSQEKNSGYENEVINFSTISDQIHKIDQIVPYTNTCNFKSNLRVECEIESETVNAIESVIDSNTNKKVHLTGKTCEIDSVDKPLDNDTNSKTENEVMPFLNEISEQAIGGTKPILKQNIQPFNTKKGNVLVSERSGLCDTKSKLYGNVNVESMTSGTNTKTNLKTNYNNTQSQIEIYSADSDQSENIIVTDSEPTKNIIEEAARITYGLKTTKSKVLTEVEPQTQELLNEPETLEINITDEDRELGL